MPFCLGLNMIELVYFTFSESLFALKRVDEVSRILMRRKEISIQIWSRE